LHQVFMRAGGFIWAVSYFLGNLVTFTDFTL
jgi:hypothetical protein